VPQPASEVPRVTSHDLCVALKLAHPSQEYVTLFEVPESTGSHYGSRADALVISLYPSRGFETCGFEFKASRADWLAELKNPGKAERIARYCDRWCVLAPSGVVREAELPVGWGLWELLPAGTLRRTVQPATREPEPMPRAFVASLLRARAKLEPEDHVALVAHHRREWEKQQRARADAPSPASLADAERVRAGMRRLEEIRAATGIDLLDFTPSRRWIERMQLADSPLLHHRLKLLRDLFDDDDLRARVRQAFDVPGDDPTLPASGSPGAVQR
jgi:hypothetical protein